MKKLIDRLPPDREHNRKMLAEGINQYVTIRNFSELWGGRETTSFFQLPKLTEVPGAKKSLI